MNLGLFEDAGCRQLLPLTWLRAAFELRCGVDRLIDKAQTYLGRPAARVWVRPALREVTAERFALAPAVPDHDWCLLNARAMLTGPVSPPATGVAWQRGSTVVAVGVRADAVATLTPELFLDDNAFNGWLETRRFRFEGAPDSVRVMDHPWELPLANQDELRRQFCDGGTHLGRIYPGAHLLNPADIYIARGAIIKPGVVLDAESGPIRIDADALIQPNAVLEGPCFVGARAIIQAGAAIRSGTSIGPFCKIGGEVAASIVHACTNKQHDGFLGHSYVGEWVNLGADTVTSNLKNTYGTIRVHINGVAVESGQQFIGAIIGDHAKTGIGTILPTGCVLGAAANVFTQRAVPKFVPSFAWLTDEGLTNYRLEKAIDIARIVVARRDVDLSPAEAELLRRTEELAREVERAGWQ